MFNEYLNWLRNLIDVEPANYSYYLLSNTMYYKVFYWSVPNDDNRACEGKNLRERFCSEIEEDYNVDLFPEEVSILEVIIGLAYRCEEIMGNNMRDWFWKMIENVGLNKYTDNDWDRRIVGDILNIIIFRTYRPNGKGGLFPLNQPKEDQRKVELWFQMNNYLVENYYSRDKIV